METIFSLLLFLYFNSWILYFIVCSDLTIITTMSASISFRIYDINRYRHPKNKPNIFAVFCGVN